MASLNKLMDWIGPLVFVGGAAYLWWAFQNGAWPFNQPVSQPMMMMMPGGGAVPVEELSRIPISGEPIMTAIPGDNMVTPLVSTGLSPVIVPTIPSTTAKNVLGVTTGMPTRQQNVITKTSTGPNQVVMASGNHQVNIGGTGATSQKSSPIPPIQPKPPVPLGRPAIPMITPPKPPTIPMFSFPMFKFPTFPTITYTPQVRF